MDFRLADIEANLSKAAEIKELSEEGATDQQGAIEELSWKSEVGGGEEFGRWSALLTSMLCALVHLPALALESCWPSLLGQIFSFNVAPPVLVTSHWVALGATLIFISFNFGFLAAGAKQRRGLLPLVLAIAGSWLVVLNPIYYLAEDYHYTSDPGHERDFIVGMLTIVGLVMLVGASSWNASLDKMILEMWGQHGQTRSSLVGGALGAHVLVANDSESDDNAPMGANSSPTVDTVHPPVTMQEYAPMTPRTAPDPPGSPKLAGKDA